jgi:hypothetical protein
MQPLHVEGSESKQVVQAVLPNRPAVYVEPHFYCELRKSPTSFIIRQWHLISQPESDYVKLKLDAVLRI